MGRTGLVVLFASELCAALFYLFVLSTIILLHHVNIFAWKEFYAEYMTLLFFGIKNQIFCSNEPGRVQHSCLFA